MILVQLQGTKNPQCFCAMGVTCYETRKQINRSASANCGQVMKIYGYCQ